MRRTRVSFKNEMESMRFSFSSQAGTSPSHTALYLDNSLSAQHFIPPCKTSKGSRGQAARESHSLIPHHW